MLFGEFAVLEGHPAVALCFDRRIACTAGAGEPAGGVRFEAPGLLDRPVVLESMDAEPPPELRLLWPLLTEAVERLGGISLAFEAGFPSTWGLGSSSASSLAAVAGVRALLGESPSDEALFIEVRDLQRRLQGAASGYDAATQLLGGVVRFQDDGGVPRLERVEAPELDWVVGYTGRKASTGAMVRAVREQHPVGAPLYARIGALAERGLEALRLGAVDALGACMNEGHGQLTALGAVPDDLVEPMTTLQGDPAVAGARMCGAGGGDCVLVLAHDRTGAAEALRRVGFEELPLHFTPAGLRREEPERHP